MFIGTEEPSFLKARRGRELPLFILLFALSSHAQTTRLIADGPRALVTEIDLDDTKPYVVTGGRYGAVWVTLSDGVNAQGSSRTVTHAEAANELEPGHSIQLTAQSPGARIIVVAPKTEHQPLTIQPFKLDHPIKDASDRNATLLIAVRPCRFIDSHAHKAQTISLKQGEIVWINSGIHEFRNAGPDVATLVSIEW